MKCPSCLAEVSGPNKFCGVCGTPVTPARDPAAETVAMPEAKGAGAKGGVRPPTSSDSFDEGRFLPGTLLAGRYRVIALLGRGGMGEVYRAADLTLGQPVALKFLPEAAASDAAVLARFHDEVRIARQVSHPNVCRVYDIGETGGQPYISMEYIDGEDLGSLLRRIGRLSGDKAAEIARKICAGLAAAHDKGVLHRDLKPANIMIDGRGQVSIMDFGLAAVATQIQGAEARHGTPAYMAPEQLSGTEATVRSDIYSFGLVLYEMFTGKRAYEGGSYAALSRAKGEAAPVSPASLVRDLDPAVERIVLRCLNPDPAQRPSSALSVLAALPGGDPLAAALAAGETPSPEIVAAAGRTEGLRPAVAIGCVAAIVAALAILPFEVRRTSWMARIPLEYSPDVLAGKAREILAHLGYGKPADSAYGLHYDFDYLTDLDRRGTSLSTLAHLGGHQPAAIRFWYRASPRSLEALSFTTGGNVTWSEPPSNVSGMAEVKLDPQGRLVWLEAQPPQIDRQPPDNQAPDSAALFKAAGLDPAAFQPAKPEWTPASAFDQRLAWTGKYPGDSNPLRIEAAWWRGKPVFFGSISPWTRPERMQEYQLNSRQKAGGIMVLLLLTAVTVMAAFLARRNIRLARGDRQGAFRVAAFLFVLSLISTLLTAHHTFTAGEILLLSMNVSASLLFAAMVWVLYMALEPYVRRRWPRTLIAWNRVLAGHFRDAMVGSHMLFGVVQGVWLAALVALIAVLQASAGASPDATVDPGMYVNFEHTFATLLAILPGSILGTLGIFFVLFLLRGLLRKEWMAALVCIVVFTALGSLAVPGNLMISAPLRALQNGLMIFVLLRFGLLAFVVASWVANLLILFPVTADFSAWYYGNAWLALGAVAALTAFAFHSALAGRTLFQRDLFEE